MSARVTRAHLQAASGLVFAAFLGLHLATTVAGALGPGAFDAALSLVRRVYAPHPAFELAVLGGAGLVHAVLALATIRGRVRALRMRRERPAGAPRPSVARAHRYAGYVLLLLAGGHVAATRLAPALGEAGARADFSFLAYSVLGWPAWFVPYYLVFGAAGAVHLALGLGLALKILWPRRFPTLPLRRASAFAAAALAALVLAGVVGITAGAASASRARFPEFRRLYERFAPAMLGLARPAIDEPPPP